MESPRYLSKSLCEDCKKRLVVYHMVDCRITRPSTGKCCDLCFKVFDRLYECEIDEDQLNLAITVELKCSHPGCRQQSVRTIPVCIHCRDGQFTCTTNSIVFAFLLSLGANKLVSASSTLIDHLASPRPCYCCRAGTTHSLSLCEAHNRSFLETELIAYRAAHLNPQHFPSPPHIAPQHCIINGCCSNGKLQQRAFIAVCELCSSIDNSSYIFPLLPRALKTLFQTLPIDQRCPPMSEFWKTDYPDQCLSCRGLTNRHYMICPTHYVEFLRQYSATIAFYDNDENEASSALLLLANATTA